MRHLAPLLGVLFLSLGALTRGATHWSEQPWRHVEGEVKIFGLASSPSRAVAVGLGGAVRYADEPDVWHNANAPVGGDLYNVVWSRGEFLAVGMGRMIASADGINWETRASPTTEPLGAIAENDGVTVVVQVAGPLWMSTNRRDWTASRLPEGWYPTDITWGRGMWVVTAMGERNGLPEGTVFTSTDGRTWTDRRAYYGPLLDVAYHNGRYAALGIFDRENRLLLSADGITWTWQPLGLVGTHSVVTVRDGQWLLLGDAPPFVSSDGVNWTMVRQTSTGGTGQINAATTFKGQTLVCAWTVMATPDLVNWRQTMRPRAGTWKRGAWGSAGFVVVGDETGAQVLTSPDGVTWTADSQPGPQADIAFGNGVYVMVHGHRVLTSYDAKNWHAQTLPLESRIAQSVRYLRGQFFLAEGNDSSSGGLWTSPDGFTWTLRSVPGATGPLYDVADNGQRLLATGRGQTSTSLDGVTWSPAEKPTYLSLKRVVGLGDGFVALSGRRMPDIALLTDGRTVTELQVIPAIYPRHEDPSDLARIGDEVAVSYVDSIMLTRDGQTWREVRLTAAGTRAVSSLIHGDGAIVMLNGIDLRVGAGPQRPTIVTQPLGAAVALGQSTTLSLRVANSAAASVQWYKDGRPLAGQTGWDLIVRPQTAADYGRFYAEVIHGEVREPSLVAAVTPTAAPERLSNISVRATAAAGDDALIAGFVVSGTEPTTLLVRTVGPGLRDFGVAGALADPRLALYRQGAGLLLEAGAGRIAPWPSTSAAAAARVGAFALQPDSADASRVLTLPAGGYSVHASSASGAAGEALIEVYALGEGRSRLTNLSTRTRIDPQKGPLIVGFVVNGTEPQPLLLRAVGPGLNPFGVTGTVNNPRLVVYDAQQREAAANDDWSTPTATSAALAGAFPLTPGSRDAALSVRLPPGAYSMHILADTAGVALAEVYLLPTEAR